MNEYEHIENNLFVLSLAFACSSVWRCQCLLFSNKPRSWWNVKIPEKSYFVYVVWEHVDNISDFICFLVNCNFSCVFFHSKNNDFDGCFLQSYVTRRFYLFLFLRISFAHLNILNRKHFIGKKKWWDIPLNCRYFPLSTVGIICFDDFALIQA